MTAYVTVRVAGQWKVGRRLAAHGDRVIVAVWRVKRTAEGLRAVEEVRTVPTWRVRERNNS